MDEAALMEFMASLGPEGLQQMIDAGLVDDRLGIEGQRTRVAAGMAQAPSAQGQSVGGTYVAANPLEHIASAMSRVMGQKGMADSQRRQDGLIQGKGQGMDALLKAMAQGQPPQQQPGGWQGVPYPNPF